MDINSFAWDSAAKEYVMISNKICVLPHENTEVFNASHKNGMASCEMVPHEAIAIRVLGFEGHRAKVGFTYRGVNRAQLTPSNAPFLKETFEKVLSPKKRTKYTVGRV